MLRTRPGEVFAKLVEGARHDTVCGVEGFLNSIPVVAVDVDVQHARDVPKELQDGQHDVVHVAEAGYARLVRMMSVDTGRRQGHIQ